MVWYLEMRYIKLLGLCSRATQPGCHQHTHCQDPPRQRPVYHRILLIWQCCLQPPQHIVCQRRQLLAMVVFMDDQICAV